MDDRGSPVSLLNVYEVEGDAGSRHLVCFLKPERAQASGIDGRAVVGEVIPGPNNELTPETFTLNPAFIEAFTGYMNDEATRSPDLISGAQSHAGGWLYILDPRFEGAEGEEPPASELLGGFNVDETGRIVPHSFTYNGEHLWFDPASGVSGVLSDLRFYDWLHPKAGSADGGRG